MKTVFLYAGQGSQRVGMGKDFYEALNYKVVGFYENKIDGYAEYFFVKQLD